MGGPHRSPLVAVRLERIESETAAELLVFQFDLPGWPGAHRKTRLHLRGFASAVSRATRVARGKMVGRAADLQRRGPVAGFRSRPRSDAGRYLRKPCLPFRALDLP